MNHQQRQNAIRGGFAIGIIASVGGVIYHLLGWSYATDAQWVIGIVGVSTGAIIGARQAAT